VFSILAIWAAINVASTNLLGAYITGPGVLTLRQSPVHFLLEEIMITLILLAVALLLQNFRSIRKNVPVPPAA